MTFLKSLKPSRQAAGSRDRQLPATPEQPSAQPEPWSEPLIGSSAKADRTVRAPDEQPLQPHMEGLSPQAASPTRSQQRDVPRASPARQPALASESAEQEDGMPDELVPLQASSAERVTELKRLLQVCFCRVAAITLDQLPSELHSKVQPWLWKAGSLACPVHIVMLFSLIAMCCGPGTRGCAAVA